MALAVAAALHGQIAVSPSGSEPFTSQDSVSAFARAAIPPGYLRLFLLAGRRFGVSWAVLAAIGEVECDDGRDPAPSCTHEGSVNAAGAGGPMQFLASTWAVYGVDGDGDGRRDRWDPADAIFSAANYLRASGAPGDYRRAIFAYNHSEAYVQQVLTLAARYAGHAESRPAPEAGVGEAELVERLQGATPTPVRLTAGEHATLAPGDGHLALVPVGVPAVVQAMVVAGNELQDLPYGPDGHPDPLGASQQDCSSTVNYILYRAGLRPLREIVAENPLAQSYTTWGVPGPGRWVTIYATASPTPHVFMTIAGLRIDTSFAGTDVGPNRDQSGPRWRIFPTIPTWARWSVRHPPGL